MSGLTYVAPTQIRSIENLYFEPMSTYARLKGESKKRWQNEFENSVLWNGIKYTIFFFVKSYASVPLRKMKKFIKKRKKVVKSREYKNLGQKLFAQL